MWWLIGGGGVLAVLAVAANHRWHPVRTWRYDWARAKHRVQFVENPAGQDFYGSMVLSEEPRRRYVMMADGWHEVANGWSDPVPIEGPPWLTQTAAELSPEALDVWGPRGPSESYAAWLAEGMDSPAEITKIAGYGVSPDQDALRDSGLRLHDSGPGDTSLAPGPDWLDRQLAAHVAWVARMAPMVTGWSVAA